MHRPVMLSQPPKITANVALARAEGPAELLTLAQCRDLLASIRDERSFGDLPEGTVWRRHAEGGQLPLARVVAERNPRRLHVILGSLHSTFVMEGFDQHARITAKLDEGAPQQSFHAKVVYGTLLRAGMALGVVRSWNPEQPQNFPYLAEDQTDAVLDGIRAALGVTVPLPVSGAGAWGLPTRHGILTHRQAISLGYLRQIREHLAVTGRAYGHLVEIGGGIGRIAHGVASLRLWPYTIVDLPMVGVVQYAFLTANGIRCHLWPRELSQVPGEVNIVSTFDQDAFDGLRGALFLNFDGLVEMAAATVEGYFARIARSGSDLLSVNHEAARMMLEDTRQNWEIGRIAGRGLRPLPRGFFWERTGYVAQSFLSPL